MWSVLFHGKEKKKLRTGQIITENNSNKAVCTEREKMFKTAVIWKWAVTVRILKKMLWVWVYRTSVCYILCVLLGNTVRTTEVCNEYALFLTVCTELTTTNNNNGDWYYYQMMNNFCLVWNSCFNLAALTQHGTTYLNTSMQAATTKGIEMIYDNLYKLRRVFTSISRSVIFVHIVIRHIPLPL